MLYIVLKTLKIATAIIKLPNQLISKDTPSILKPKMIFCNK